MKQTACISPGQQKSRRPRSFYRTGNSALLIELIYRLYLFILESIFVDLHSPFCYGHFRDDFIDTVYKRIRNTRKKSMVQDELTRLCGYTHQPTIHKIEIEGIDLPLSKIEKFAEALNAPAYVMGRDNNITADRPSPSEWDESFRKRRSTMNQKKCMMCGAHLEEKLAPCMEDHDGGCVVIVRNVPALVCTQYGETYYTPAVLKRLDEILAAVKSSLSEVTIVNFHTPRDPLAAAQTVSY